MNKWKRSRLKIALLSDIFCLIIAVFSIYKDMGGVASAAIGAIISVTSMYIYSEGKRPTENV